MSFLDQVKAWSTTAPSLPDLEATDLESGKLVERGEDNFEQSGPAGRSKLRRGLALNDAKYRGTKVSRKDIFDESSKLGDLDPTESNDEEDSDNEDEEGDDESDISDDEQIKLGSGVEEDDDFSGEEALEQLQLGRNKTRTDDSDEDIDDEENDFDDEEEDEEEEEDEDQENEDDGEPSAKRTKIKVNDVLSEKDNDKELKKANDVADQIKLWDQVLFLKIKLQGAMRAFNRLPRGKQATELLALADEDTKRNFKLARSNVKHLILNLLDAEKVLVDGSVQSKGALEGLMLNNSDDEEIESSEDEKDDDEDEGDTKGDDEEDENEAGVDLEDEEDDEDIEEDEHSTSGKGSKKALSFKEVESILKEREKNYSKFRDETIKKWETRTKLVPTNKQISATDFSSFLKEGILEQIRNLMRDTDKVERKFHVKRAEGDRIGGDDEADIDEEIFDDDDFNDILLKELIDKKAKTVSDPVAMTRHYIEMKKLQNKRQRKRRHDREAVKDRTIKYVPIPALLNFHPARPETSTWSHEARNELYMSLFK